MLKENFLENFIEVGVFLFEPLIIDNSVFNT